MSTTANKLTHVQILPWDILSLKEQRHMKKCLSRLERPFLRLAELLLRLKHLPIYLLPYLCLITKLNLASMENLYRRMPLQIIL